LIFHKEAGFLNEVSATIIGIDCATDAKKVGLALGELTPGGLVVRELLTGDRAKPSLHELLAHWIRASTPALLALDAPFGWPIGMRCALQHHLAGLPLTVEPNHMFRRLTDRFVKIKTRKTPLDVGADRIARTAHSALVLLENTRRTLGHDIPLAWSPRSSSGVEAIEVYPALTLLALDLDPRNYKSGEAGRVARGVILDALKKHIRFDEAVEEGVLAVSDLMDAVLCVLAGRDFLCGNCFEPPQNHIPIVRNAGWIWFRGPVALGHDETPFT
jgi:predicted RNase H-like nuclease